MHGIRDRRIQGYSPTRGRASWCHASLRRSCWWKEGRGRRTRCQRQKNKVSATTCNVTSKGHPYKEPSKASHERDSPCTLLMQLLYMYSESLTRESLKKQRGHRERTRRGSKRLRNHRLCFPDWPGIRRSRGSKASYNSRHNRGVGRHIGTRRGSLRACKWLRSSSWLDWIGLS